MINPIENLIGLFCIKAYEGYAGRILISFSADKNKINQSKIDKLKAEWVFEIVSSAWRLQITDIFLAGSYQQYEQNDKELTKLIGLKLISASINNKTDVTLHFENGFTLDTFCQGNSFPSIEIYSEINYTNESHLILLETGLWVKNAVDEDFTDIEEIENKHSENCYNRWINIVPQKTFDNHCRDCSYFLPIRGQFYFWDFGLCSNDKSLFDGRVVGVKSSCEYFDEDIIIEN